MSSIGSSLKSIFMTACEICVKPNVDLSAPGDAGSGHLLSKKKVKQDEKDKVSAHFNLVSLHQRNNFYLPKVKFFLSHAVIFSCFLNQIVVVL